MDFGGRLEPEAELLRWWQVGTNTRQRAKWLHWNCCRKGGKKLSGTNSMFQKTLSSRLSNRNNSGRWLQSRIKLKAPLRWSQEASHWTYLILRQRTLKTHNFLSVLKQKNQTKLLAECVYVCGHNTLENHSELQILFRTISINTLYFGHCSSKPQSSHSQESALLFCSSSETNWFFFFKKKPKQTNKNLQLTHEI